MQLPREQPQTVWNPAMGAVTRRRSTCTATNPSRDSAPAHPGDAIDEDEYFRTCGVFEYAHRNPRG